MTTPEIKPVEYNYEAALAAAQAAAARIDANMEAKLSKCVSVGIEWNGRVPRQGHPLSTGKLSYLIVGRDADNNVVFADNCYQLCLAEDALPAYQIVLNRLLAKVG